VAQRRDAQHAQLQVLLARDGDHAPEAALLREGDLVVLVRRQVPQRRRRLALRVHVPQAHEPDQGLEAALGDDRVVVR